MLTALPKMKSHRMLSFEFLPFLGAATTVIACSLMVNAVRYGRLMLTELFAQLTEEGLVTVYTADDCMTAWKGF